MMRTLNVRHPSIRCIAEALLDLFPSGADVSEIGLEPALCLFVSWRTAGTANRPGNIAWGVHYRFEADVLGMIERAPEAARRQICERLREMSRHLQFDYADPDAVSLLIVDASADALREQHGLDPADSPRVP
jgi:hypothetical protein